MSVEVSGLSFSYGERAVLSGVSFTVPDGCLCSILGRNGTGKSTLLRCMLGLLRGYTGSVRVGGEDVRHMRPTALARKVAYIPQSHYPAFNYSVLDMVLMGACAHKEGFASPGRREEEAARAALERLGLSDFAGRDYLKLSGGERQLVLIARALAQQSRVLLLDEPAASLDFGNQTTVMARLRALAREGYTVIQTTHSPEQAYMVSDKLLAMRGGRVIADGAPRDVLDAALVEQLYGVRARIESLRGDRVRVCVPEDIDEL